MGMADDLALMRALRDYQPPQAPPDYQPLSTPAEPRPAQVVPQWLQPRQPSTPFGFDLGTAGNNRRQLLQGLDPRYLQLFYGKQF